jgi:hypothetical protein
VKSKLNPNYSKILLLNAIDEIYEKLVKKKLPQQNANHVETTIVQTTVTNI